MHHNSHVNGILAALQNQVLDIFFTSLLALFFGLHVLGYSYLESTLKVPGAIISTAYCFSTIPLIYLIGFVVVRSLRQFCRSRYFKSRIPIFMHTILQQRHCGQHSPTFVDGDQHPNRFVTYSEVSITTDDDSIPDRLANPFLYNSSHASVHCTKHMRTPESAYGSIN